MKKNSYYKNTNSKSLIKRFLKSFWTVILSVTLIYFVSEPVNAQEYLRVYTSAPGVMQSNVSGGTVLEEGFEGFPHNDYNWAPLPNGYTSSLGVYKQIGGQSYIQHDDIFGAGTGKYMAIKVGGSVKLTFNNPVRYFGFAWPAGDGQNNIKILRNGQVIGTFATSDVISLLPKDHNHYITSVDGTNYSTYDYYGKPGSGGNHNEPYAFLHFVATDGLAFDEIIFSMGYGGEFENDNHTLLLGTPEVQGDWVELISIEAPTANDDNATGIPGQPVEIDVLANDVPGDAAIDPSTVQIDGTASPGDPLVVAGEGTWTVNPTTGAITFTPDASLIGSPTPIQYSVLDENDFASNFATVTVTYPIGPNAVDDNALTAINIPVDIDVLANDTAGSTPIDPTSVTFVSGTEPNPATEGTFTVDGTTGLVTFTPVNGFAGVVTVDYKVCDQNSLCDVATITVQVAAGTINEFPATGFGTLAFEDLWPAMGDYDFNDLVVDYHFKVNTNILNYVESVQATFIIRAVGAYFENGFGFQLSSAIDPSNITVTGYTLSENIITLDGNGTEAGQNAPTIIVFDNAFTLMPNPGGGIGVNTEEDAPYVTPDTVIININFAPNTVTYNQLDISNFNPFIFIDKNRGAEVHLPDYPPTALADQSIFGNDDDDTNPANGKYYKTKNNLPWAINIYESFDYPIEKQDISQTYLKFAEWATSGGAVYQDWYKDLPGYRDNSKIYTPPSNK